MMPLSNNQEIFSIKKFTLFICFAIAFSGSLYGYNIGAMAGALLFIKQQMHLSHAQSSAFVAAFLWGAAAVMLFMGKLPDYWGRKKMLLAAGLLSLLSVIGMVTSQTINELIAARFISGLACGMLTLTVPVYLAEIMPPTLRGRGTMAFQLCLCFGIVLATFVSWCFSASENWRMIFSIEFIPTIILFLATLFTPESPRWLVAKQKNQAALKVLLKFSSQATAEQTLQTILSNVDQTAQKIKIWQHRKFFLPLLLATLISSLTQLTGINSILQYDSLILSLSGFDEHHLAIFASVIVTVINFIVTLIALFIIDRIERKHLLQIGVAGLICCLLLLSAVSHFMAPSHLKGMVITSLLLGFILFFAIAPGAMVWTLLAELLPAAIRSRGLAIALLLSSFSGALLASIFLPLERMIGLSGIFLLCTLTTCFYLLTSFFIPKTKGKSLEEIEQQLQFRKILITSCRNNDAKKSR